ncbi:17-beta-hydroxysteroid dehydrogenase 13 [Drosophila montana]|uniref:17-beta-hydroxysteroid dehydrogenase 13 n=1 Tax=Drosophila montana TaxID=40370 RepID=UPI00313ADDCD
MSLHSALIKLQAAVALLVLLCATPLLLLAALVAKICESFYTFIVQSKTSVKGEVALVTGGAHGLGRAMSLELAKMGCHMAIVDIDLQGAEETVKQISETFTVKAKAYKVNVANYTELNNLKSNIVNDLGPVTILVNNAGILLLNNSVEPDPNDVQRMIDVNLTSHFWTKSVFLPTMKLLRKGHIVTISSLSSIFSLPYNSPYSASKSGVSGHMKALRLELAFERQHNIHVCTVMPSFLQTNDEITEIAKNVRFNDFYPLISGPAAARRIVQGMLRGEREIILPGIASIMYRALALLPVSWQDNLFLLIANKQIHQFYKLRI